MFSFQSKSFYCKLEKGKIADSKDAYCFQDLFKTLRVQKD